MIGFVIIVLLLAPLFYWPCYIDRRHLKSLEAREQKAMNLRINNLKKLPIKAEEVLEQSLVIGSVVLSINLFKRLIARFKMILGGRIPGYELLVDRARREAIVRMKEQAFDFDLIINLKIETSSISIGHQNTVNCIEVIAYGTAIKIRS